MAATRFLRAGRLSLEQCHPVERSFDILRRMPNIATLSTKAGNSKKPIRYTSIKKAKPKTIIDIGQLILQRANETKGNKQPVIANAALKASQTAYPSESKPTDEECSSAETFAPPAMNGEHLRNPTTKFSYSVDSGPSTSKITKNIDDLCNGTTSVNKRVPEYEGHETTHRPTATKNIFSPEASEFLELSSTSMSTEASARKMMESTMAPNFGSDEITSTDVAKVETGHAAEIKDMMYSEEVAPINVVTRADLASPGTSNAVHATSENVGPSTPFSPKDAVSDVLIIERSTSEKGSKEASPVLEHVGIGVNLENTVSSPETVTVSESRATSVMSSPDDALLDFSTVTDDVGVPEGSASQTERIATMTEELPVKPEIPFQVIGAQSAKSPGPSNTETAKEELRMEEDTPSDAQLDPIQRLFLEKIREYSTKARDGLPDAGPEYEKAFAEEVTKLQRLYGNGDLTAFPEFKFPEPLLDEISTK